MRTRKQFDTGVDAQRNSTAPKRAAPGRPRRVRIRSLAARGLAVALLVALAALPVLPVQAQAANEVWSATLTIRDSSGVLGCSDAVANNFCSDHLSDDDFTHDSTDYAITLIVLHPSGQLDIAFDRDLTVASRDLTLNVDGTAFRFEDANSSTATARQWNNAWVSWTAGETASLSLTEVSTEPANPTELTATAMGETQIDLSWTAPSDDGGEAISGYKVEVSSNGGSTWSNLVADTGSTETSYSHIDLSAGTTRSYRASAINSVGVGSSSRAVTATTAAVNVLGSNTGQSGTPTHGIGIGDADRRFSQGFQTGSNPGGYSLDSVGVYFQFEGLEARESFAVHIYTADNTGALGTLVYTLTSPNSYTDVAVNTFTAPAGATLDADSDYHVVFEGGGDWVADVILGVAQSNKEDDGSRGGWSIEDARRYDAVPFSGGTSFQISVNGTAIPTDVLSTWALVPTGPVAGDTFRLLFLSSTTRDATDIGIGAYNTFVQDRAGAGHTAIQEYSSGFRVVGCTASAHARDNTGTIYTTSDKGVPIYWLNGAKAADDYEDFYDGDWDDEANDKNESGSDGPDTSQFDNYPFTGCNHDGHKVGFRATSAALGAALLVRVGRPNSTDIGHGPLSAISDATFPNDTRPLYGLSELFRVVAADTAGVTVSESALTVTEEDTTGDSYTVVLNREPTADVTVTFGGHANTDVTPTPATLTFTTTDWQTPQAVTVTAAADADTTNDTVSLTHSATSTDADYQGIAIAGVTVTVNDNDSPSVTVSETALTVTEEDTTGGSYTVVLRTQPSTTVTVTFGGHANTDVTPTPATLTFTTTDWQTPQAVTITAAADADTTNDTVSLTHSATSTDSDYGGITIAGVTVAVNDNDTAPPVITGGGGGGGGPSGPSPSKLDFEWTVSRDIDELDVGHGSPSGMWSDGATLWLAENGDGADDAVYAYDLKSGERGEDREFELDERNRAPRGVWSDRTTLWVSDSGQERLFAHDLASGERLSDSDIELAERNADPRGIWSDEVTMWVLDGIKDSLFAYDLETGDLLGEYPLGSRNSDPRGIWSDRVTIWISDAGASPRSLFAYRLPVPAEEQGEEDEDGELERVRDEDFTELSNASNNSPRGIWSDGDVMYVVDASDGKVYTYNMPDAIDARLASLTLSGVDFGEFDGGRTEYEGVPGEGVAETTVEATTVQRRTEVGIHPTDADGNEANGHQVAFEGTTEITVTVTSADGSRTKTYRVTVQRPEVEVALAPTWTSIEWPGADGVIIVGALQDGDIGDKVVVVYHWDEATAAWRAFFPGLEGVPGLNTLTNLEQGRTYWIAVAEPVTWTVATP